jgi:hypothetical protein
VGYGEELNGTAYNGFLVDVPDLYTWFQWGTTTAYGNVSPTVHGMSPPDHSMSYMITAALQPNTVYHYQAVASNYYGISYGADATFISAGPPVITNQPQSQTVAVGSTVTFTVGASASDNILYYQWKKYEEGVDFPWVNIPSATSSSLTVSNAQSSDAGTYRVVVSSDWGGMWGFPSSPALLIVGSGPILKAGVTNGNLVLSWLASQAGYNLETSTNPNSTNWTSAAGARQTNSDTITITVPASDAQRFFRLRYP